MLNSLETAFSGRFVDFSPIDDVCCCFASPFTAEPAICQTLSQTFAVDEAALQDNFIDFKVVPGLKNELNAAKDDLVLFWTTQVPVRFPVLIEAAHKCLVLFGNTWSCESGFSAMNQIKNNLRCRLKDTRLWDLLRLSISLVFPTFGQLSKNMQYHPSHSPHSLDVLTSLALFRKCSMFYLYSTIFLGLAKADNKSNICALCFSVLTSFGPP